jgi:hypothetical protein
MTEPLKAMQEMTETQIGTLASQMYSHQARREVIQEKRLARCQSRKDGRLFRKNEGLVKRDDGLPRSDGGLSRKDAGLSREDGGHEFGGKSRRNTVQVEASRSPQGRGCSGNFRSTE